MIIKSEGDWVGIAFGDINKSRFLGGQEKGWALSSFEFAYHNGTEVSRRHPRFSQGSRVTLTLNLLPNQEGNGTLQVSVDDGECFVVFENLRNELQGSNDGFVPAVSHCPGGKFRLLRIVKLN